MLVEEGVCAEDVVSGETKLEGEGGDGVCAREMEADVEYAGGSVGDEDVEDAWPGDAVRGVGAEERGEGRREVRHVLTERMHADGRGDTARPYDGEEEGGPEGRRLGKRI